MHARAAAQWTYATGGNIGVNTRVCAEAWDQYKTWLFVHIKTLIRGKCLQGASKVILYLSLKIIQILLPFLASSTHRLLLNYTQEL